MARDPDSDKPITLNRNRVARLFGVTVMTVSNWVDEGMPKSVRGQYDADACVQWYRARMDRKHAERDAAGDAKEQLTRAQVERTQLEVQQLRGELVEATEFQRVVNQAATVIASQLDGLGPRVAGELAGMTDVAAIQSVIFRETRAIRSSIADAVAAFADTVEEEAQA